MLKACCECMGGAFGVQENERFGQHNINGVTQFNQPIPPSPPWPQPRPNETMFVLPRSLRRNDKITVTGTMRANPTTLTVNLITGDRTLQPDYDNIACQLNAIFPNESSNQNEISVRVIQDGLPLLEDGKNLATDLITDLNFNFIFQFHTGTGFHRGTYITVIVGESSLNDLELQHNLEDIRFLSVSGDVERVSNLEFEFA